MAGRGGRTVVLCGMAVAAATAAVWGFAVRGHASRLLPPKGPAAWVVSPSPFDTQIHPAAEVRAVFHRRFVVPRAPAAAMLEVRAFGRAVVSLNGARLPGSDAAAPDARQSGSWDVAGYLHPGDNAIAVEVASTLGPRRCGCRCTAPMWRWPATTRGTSRWKVPRLGRSAVPTTQFQ